jgi:hypothetical protein
LGCDGLNSSRRRSKKSEKPGTRRPYNVVDRGGYCAIATCGVGAAVHAAGCSNDCSLLAVAQHRWRKTLRSLSDGTSFPLLPR